LAHYTAETEAFLPQIITGDETWIHHFQLETERQSMEWHHTACTQRNKVPSTSNIMVTVLWNYNGMILMDVMPGWQTINSENHPNS
jgi:hypothetical protein